MTIPLLILRLQAPYQAWGYGSRWDYRRTNKEPTKSGIVGLLASALGYYRNDPRVEELSNNIKVSIRVENEGDISTDYHIVLGPHIRYNLTTRKETIQSWRYYLADAVFLVIISGKKELLMEIRDALKNPECPYFLGRKSCVPTAPVLVELTEQYSSIMETIENYPYGETTKYLRKKKGKKAPRRIRYVIDDTTGDKFQTDKIKTGSRMYEPRAFKEGWIDAPAEIIFEDPSQHASQEVSPDTESDQDLTQNGIDDDYEASQAEMDSNDFDEFYGFDTVSNNENEQNGGEE